MPDLPSTRSRSFSWYVFFIVSVFLALVLAPALLAQGLECHPLALTQGMYCTSLINLLLFCSSHAFFTFPHSHFSFVFSMILNSSPHQSISLILIFLISFLFLFSFPSSCNPHLCRSLLSSLGIRTFRITHRHSLLLLLPLSVDPHEVILTPGHNKTSHLSVVEGNILHQLIPRAGEAGWLLPPPALTSSLIIAHSLLSTRIS